MDGKLDDVLGLSTDPTLYWCKELGINEVSVYAFSIENFHRDQEEVNFLLSLAEEKLMELLKDRSMLNIFLAYTSREEITSTVEKVYRGVQQELILPSDIDTNLLSKCLYTRNCQPLDLLIRTSGEVRVSDFLVWQASWDGAVYKFVDSFWPDFNLNDFLSVLLHYQLSRLYRPPSHVTALTESACECSSPTTGLRRSRPLDHTRQCRVEFFLQQLDREYWYELEKMRLFSVPSHQTSPPMATSESRVSQRSVGDTAFA